MRIIIYTGKGGTGKSALSCATAVKAADMNHEVLVVSSDPSHTLMDLFETKVRSEPTKIAEHLWAFQLDPVREVREKYRVIQEYVASLFQARGLDEVLAYEVASLPNMTPFLSLLSLVDFFEEGGYDAIILDTLPSGETLKNLYLPVLVGSMSRKLLKLTSSFVRTFKIVESIVKIPAPSKQVIDADIKLLDRMERLKEILTNPEVASLRLVANPDSFSISNMRRTYMTASLYDINADLAIVNKFLPEEVSDRYFEGWVKSQIRYLAEAEVSFHPLPLRKVKLFNEELKGLHMLRKCGEELFKDDDPLSVFHKGQPFRMESGRGWLKLIVKTPFLNKDKCEVDRVGDELIVKVDSEVGEIISFTPLPAATYCMKLSRAGLIDGELHIFFEDEGDG